MSDGTHKSRGAFIPSAVLTAHRSRLPVCAKLALEQGACAARRGYLTSPLGSVLFPGKDAPKSKSHFGEGLG